MSIEKIRRINLFYQSSRYKLKILTTTATHASKKCTKKGLTRKLQQENLTITATFQARVQIPHECSEGTPNAPLHSAHMWLLARGFTRTGSFCPHMSARVSMASFCWGVDLFSSCFHFTCKKLVLFDNLTQKKIICHRLLILSNAPEWLTYVYQ